MSQPTLTQMGWLPHHNTSNSRPVQYSRKKKLKQESLLKFYPKEPPTTNQLQRQLNTIEINFYKNSCYDKHQKQIPVKFHQYVIACYQIYLKKNHTKIWYDGNKPKCGKDGNQPKCGKDGNQPKCGKDGTQPKCGKLSLKQLVNNQTLWVISAYDKTMKEEVDKIDKIKSKKILWVITKRHLGGVGYDKCRRFYIWLQQNCTVFYHDNKFYLFLFCHCVN